MWNLTTMLWLGVAALATARRSASPKPNFSGRWRANFAKSSLQIPLPEATVFIVEHEEPDLVLSRTHTSNGKRDTWSIQLTTDGRQVVQRSAEREIRCRAYWEGEALVFEARLSTGEGGEGHNLVHYRMAEDGNAFTAFERYRSPSRNYDNLWRLERISEDALSLDR